MIKPGILRKIGNVDPVLAFSVFILLCLGTVMIYSSSTSAAAERYGDGMFFLKRHVFHLFVAAGFGLTVFFLQPRWLKSMAVPGLFLVVGMLVFTLFSKAGVSANQATRWIDLGIVKLQPSELLKPVLLMYVALYLAKKQEQIKTFTHGLLPVCLVVILILALVLQQPDFGSTVLLAITVGVVLFVGGIRLIHMLPLLLGAITLAYALIQGADYRRRRLLAFLNPWEDPQGSGFQIIQSFVAFQRGGFSGQGLGDGGEKLLYLPEPHTDFIFAIIAEELGFLGTMAVIVLFVLISIQGFRLALRLKDIFASHLVLGLTILLSLQAFLNMAVVMGLLPTKGLTLPFISYGGSSLVASIVSISIILSLSASINMSEKMARRLII